MYKLVLLCAATLALGYPKGKEDNPQSPDLKMIGGDTAKIQDYPYQASLLFGLMHVCGATIIDANWVVTSAQCTARSNQDDFQVHTSSGQIVIVKKIYSHPNYDVSTSDFDISVLELLEPLRLDENASAIGLVPSGTVLAEGTKGNVTGWGSNGDNDGELEVIHVSVSDADSCNSFYKVNITENMICVGSEKGGENVCKGDFGGPLVVDGKLAGIISWGQRCEEPDHVMVYSNVGTLGDFVRNITGLDL